MNNDGKNILSTEELKRRWVEGLAASEAAVHQCYPVYRKIKRLVEKINSSEVDVADYYPTAVELGSLLKEMTSGYSNTVFHYYADHIDPRKKGDVRCFRMECRQLLEHCKELERHRALQQRLHVIK